MVDAVAEWCEVADAHWLKGAMKEKGAASGFWKDLFDRDARLDPYLVWVDQTLLEYKNQPLLLRRRVDGRHAEEGTRLWSVLVESKSAHVQPDVDPSGKNQPSQVGWHFRVEMQTPPQLVGRLQALGLGDLLALELASPRVVGDFDVNGHPKLLALARASVPGAPKAKSAFLTSSSFQDLQVGQKRGADVLKWYGLDVLGPRIKLTTKGQTTDRPPPPLICVIDDQCNFASRAFGKRIKYEWNQNSDEKTLRREEEAEQRRKLESAQNGRAHPPLKSNEGGGGIERELWPNSPDDNKDQSEIDRYRNYGLLYPPPRWSHGSAVLDLLAGHDLRLANVGPGTAREEIGRQRWKRDPPGEVVFVQLPLSTVLDTSGGSLSSHALQGILYALTTAKYGQSVIVNLSYGTHMGPHNGSSMFERALREMLERYNGTEKSPDRKTLYVVLPAGNSHVQRCHASRSLGPEGTVDFLWKVLPDDPTDNFVEIWVGDDDCVEVTLQPPGGAPKATVCAGQAKVLEQDHKVLASVIFPKHAAQSRSGRMILVAVSPTRAGGYSETAAPDVPGTDYADSLAMGVAPHGVWTISVRNCKTSTSKATDYAYVHAWVQRGDFAPGRGRENSGYVGRQPYFVDDGTLLVNPMFTINGIATFRHPRLFVVGAMRQRDHAVAKYTGAGPRSGDGMGLIGPDVITIADESIHQPGLLLRGVSAGSRVRVSGTSMAAPMVARLLYEHLAAGNPVDTFAPVLVADEAEGVDMRAEGEPERANPIHCGQWVRLVPTTEAGGLIEARSGRVGRPLPGPPAPAPPRPPPGDDGEAGEGSPVLPASP